MPHLRFEQSKREQKLIDVVFEIAVRMHQGEISVDSREKIAEYVARQLRGVGFDTRPAGMSWGVLRERNENL